MSKAADFFVLFKTGWFTVKSCMNCLSNVHMLPVMPSIMILF